MTTIYILVKYNLCINVNLNYNIGAFSTKEKAIEYFKNCDDYKNFSDMKKFNDGTVEFTQEKNLRIWYSIEPILLNG